MTLTTLRLSETNLKVSYRAAGQGAPLVFIHGVGMQSAAWQPQLTRFAKGYRVIAVDIPGHGGSDPLPGDSDLPAYIAWARAVLDGLGLGPVNLVGHSMGALIAGGLAVSCPDHVLRIAVLNGVFRRDATARAAVQSRAAEIRAGHVDLDTPLRRWFDENQNLIRDQVAGWLRAVDQGGYATAYSAFAKGDGTYADRFDQIACPFLAITGDGDPNSTPAMAQMMAQLVQDGRSVTINGHRHMVNLTAADAVNAQLQSWLEWPARQTATQES